MIFNKTSIFHDIIKGEDGDEMKLLLVEDEKRMAEALTELLRLEKYVVDLCTEGISGLDPR